MYNTKHDLPEKTRTAEQYGDRQRYSPRGVRSASLILSQLQTASARNQPLNPLVLILASSSYPGFNDELCISSSY